MMVSVKLYLQRWYRFIYIQFYKDAVSNSGYSVIWWKRRDRKWHYPGIRLRRLRKIIKALIRRIGVRVEILTNDVPNRYQKPYRLREPAQYHVKACASKHVLCLHWPVYAWLGWRQETIFLRWENTSIWPPLRGWHSVRWWWSINGTGILTWNTNLYSILAPSEVRRNQHWGLLVSNHISCVL